MAVVYILAHFDDEYGAWPMILTRARSGIDQRFLYVADYATPAISAARLAESRAMLGALGVKPQAVVHVGAGTGVQDGEVHAGLPAAREALRSALAGMASVERIVVVAWEGGHHDHDCCAFMAVDLAGGVPVEQFSLYQGRGLPGRLFRACAPMAENGPEARVGLSAGDWLAYLAAVRFFPSQWRAWIGLWPAMFATFILRGGFAHQHLAPERVRQRPHAGRLLYERMFGVSYETVRGALDALP